MKRTTFRQLLITYALGFALLLIIALITYVCVYGMFEERCLQSNTAAISGGLDSLADDVNSFSLLVAQQRRLPTYTRISTLAHPFAPRQLLWMENARQAMEQTLAGSSPGDYVLDCALVYQNGACITLKRTYESLSAYYGTFFYYNGVTLPDWRALLKRSANAGSIVLGQQGAYIQGVGCADVMTIVQSARYHNNSDVVNVAFMLIDAQSVLGSLVTPDVLDSCAITLTSGGEVLAWRGVTPASGMRTIEYSSPRLPMFSVRVDIPLGTVLGQMRPLITMLIVSLALYMLVGIAAALLFAWRNSRPICNLAQTLSARSGQQPSRNEYEFVAGEFDRIDSDLKRTRNELVTRENAMRAVAVERLMCGAAFPDGDGHIVSALFDDLPKRYRLCMLRALSPGDDAADRLMAGLPAISAYLRDAIGCSSRIYGTSGARAFFILPSGDDDAGSGSCVQRLELLRGQISAKLDLRVAIAVSDAFSRPESLPQACNQARQILRMLPGNMARTVTRADLPERSAWVPVEYTESQRFYEALVAGNRDSALAMIRGAFDSVRCDVDGEMYLEQVFFTFRRVFDRLAVELRPFGIGPLPHMEYSNLAGIDELVSALCDGVNDVSDGIERSREKRMRMFDNSIMEYIDSHICESDLCARTVAEHFSLPERDIQALVRRTASAGFFEYVENLRMARARELILTTALPITDIAQTCGFALPNSFYKAFKRRFGTSPSALRDDARACESPSQPVTP